MIGFILTKWYVNFKIGDLIADGLIGFILTKWYVNSQYAVTPGNNEFSFILTKWYVNGTKYDIETQLNKGVAITIVAEEKVDDDGIWGKAKSGYWVNKKYLEFVKYV